MISRSFQTVQRMREAWKRETYFRCQSFLSESAVKYLHVRQRKIQICPTPRANKDNQIPTPCPNSAYNIQTIKYRKSSIWEMKEDEYTKSLAKNQVCVIFDMQDIRENVLPKFKKLCMEMPYWCPFEGRKYGGQKPTETSVFKLSNKSVNSLLEELTKIKVILFYSETTNV